MNVVIFSMIILGKGEEKSIRLGADVTEERIEVREQGSAVLHIVGAMVLQLEVVLSGADASLEVIGRFEGKGEERQEIILRVIQQAPRTSARVDFRVALRDGSSSFFDGLIRVEEGAKDAKGFLSYRALLLSPGARAKPIPRLEVLTKEVASLGHAASVGKIDVEQMFYLQSRGLPREAAERLIIDGFLAIPKMA